MFVSIRLGFVRTAIKGRIDATPIVSSNAIIEIKIKIKTARIFSALESKKK